MKKINADVYRFKELPSDVKDEVMATYIQCLLNRPYERCSPKMKKAIKIAEKNRVPWFVGDIYYHDCGGEQESENILNKHWFFIDGELYNED